MSGAHAVEAARELLAMDADGPELRKLLLERLRSARARVQADAEGFEMVVHAIERLGRQLHPDGNSLRDYEPHLIALLKQAGLDTSDLDEQLFLLRQTRNDHAHQGAHARNAAREAVRVALRLEEALSIGWKDIRVGHLMVDAVCAAPWETLGDVRLRLLENSFTALPALIEGRWYLLTDRWLARQLAGRGRDDRDQVVRTQVQKARLPEPVVRVAHRDDRLGDLDDLLDQPLILVAASVEAERLDGVLAPSDLL